MEEKNSVINENENENDNENEMKNNIDSENDDNSENNDDYDYIRKYYGYNLDEFCNEYYVEKNDDDEDEEDDENKDKEDEQDQSDEGGGEDQYELEKYSECYKPQPIKIPEIDYSKMFKEVTFLNNIKTYITYINTDNEIESIVQKKIFLNNQDNIVTRKQLIEVIKNSQKKYNTKYKLISVMVYNIHVTPESLPSYIENPNEFISLFTLNRIESFELKSTLRLLKKYNGIYFFFFECPESDTKSDKTETSNSSTKSSTFIKNNNTKRIHISGLHKQKKQNHKKTKRFDRYVNLL
jgi:hypothetical protein